MLDVRDAVSQSSSEAVGQWGHAEKQGYAKGELAALVEEGQEVWSSSTKRGFEDSKEAAADDEVSLVLDCARRHGCNTPAKTKGGNIDVCRKDLPEDRSPLHEDIADIEGVQDPGPLPAVETEVIIGACGLRIADVAPI